MLNKTKTTKLKQHPSLPIMKYGMREFWIRNDYSPIFLAFSRTFIPTVSEFPTYPGFPIFPGKVATPNITRKPFRPSSSGCRSRRWKSPSTPPFRPTNSTSTPCRKHSCIATRHRRLPWQRLPWQPN